MAVFPVAAGHPDYSSTSTNGFIPQIWSGKLVRKFYASTVFGEIANTDYEGEIKNSGDTVLIRTVPDITIRTWRKGQALTYETPESAKTSLVIDKGKYFAYSIDSVDKYQSDIALLDKWAEDAGYGLKGAIDTDVLGNIYADAHADNIGATAGVKSGGFNLGATLAPIAVTKDNIVDYIVDCGTVLTEQNLPEDGRWIVIPAWMANYLKKSDIKDASMTGDAVSPLRNGRIGVVDQFTIYVSNNLTAVTDGSWTCYNVCFGHKSAVTFASQITDMETLPNPNAFGQLIRGLNVYGYKVVTPKALGNWYVRKG